MKNFTLVIFFLLGQYFILEAQIPDFDKLGSKVKQAIVFSEKALFNASFEKAIKKIELSKFENKDSFSDEHKIALLLQKIRIEGYRNILFLVRSNPEERINSLLPLLPAANKLENEELKAKYLLALASTYRTIGKRDSSQILENEAMHLLQQSQNHEALANLKANQISRRHNGHLAKGEKEQILALISSYQEEINYSARHSKFAQAYNTRHLAQIHRRQTLNYEESLRLFKISLALREEIGFKPFIPASYSSLGDVYIKMEAYDLAIQAYLKSAKLAHKISFARYESYPYLQIGDLYFQQGEMKKARAFYKKAMKKAQKNGFSSGLEEASEKIKKTM